MTSCCTPEQEHDHDHHGGSPLAAYKRDWLMLGSLGVIVTAVALYFSGLEIPYVHHFGAAVLDLLSMMWWGVLAGILAVGMMQRVPREYFNAMLGRGDTFGGILRAATAGLLLDLCSHGILMVGAKLYERGASLAQVMTFLIASPWNSLSLTLILIAMIGWQWTLGFIVASAVIAIVTGMIYVVLVKKGVLPSNPNTVDLPEGFNVIADAKQRLKGWRPNAAFFKSVIRDGFSEGRMVMRWLLFGLILAALMRTFVSTDALTHYFGPTLLGLLLTLVATTVIEVCSEGSTPIGADLVTRAGAPGNGFAFLMAGVATDYTEIMVLREITKSWKIALSLPIVTVPQILVLGYIMNIYGAG